MADASDVLKASDSIMRIVEDAGKRSLARSRVLADLKYGTPSEIEHAKSALQAEVVSVTKLRAACDALARSLKNAEATLDKMDATAKKDQATLDALAKSGGGSGKELDESSPFILAIHTGRDAVCQRLKFAAADFVKLRDSVSRDPNMNSHRDPKAARVVLEKLSEAAESLTEAERMMRSIDMG
ncbi:MAG: hypothetical protein SFY69_05400 [Planctomycetota bacterium]|nr:hypothetical protein [Planctomycetota bacterium]